MLQAPTKTQLCKRIIPCLDIANGRTVKGINFGNLRDAGDPVALSLRYEEEGADELAFLDITASLEDRQTMVSLVERVADCLSIPFTVGGGVRSVDDARRLLASGADKVTINTAAVLNPNLIEKIASECGSQACVVAIDARWSDGVWEVLTNGGKVSSGLSAIDWAREAVSRGAGEILLTSWDRDGSRSGFDLALTRACSQAVSAPVIASGGAKDPQSFIEVFQQGEADAALAASIFHDREYSIKEVKSALQSAGVQIRPC